MKKLTSNQISALNRIRASKGRFFGLYTIKGEAINAQFLGETDSFVTVFDRNNKTDRKLAKTSIKAVNLN